MSGRAVCPITRDVCIDGCQRRGCWRERPEKVHIWKVLGSWRASLLNVHFAIGISPCDAYRNLEIYLLSRSPKLVRKYMSKI